MFLISTVSPATTSIVPVSLCVTVATSPLTLILAKTNVVVETLDTCDVAEQVTAVPCPSLLPQVGVYLQMHRYLLSH